MTKKTVTAVFSSRTLSDTALVRLEAAGYTKDQVTMLVTKETQSKHFVIDEDSKAGEGAIEGAAIGGLSAALYLALGSVGALFVPGLNIVVSGALIGALTGLGAGAVTGGLVGALVGLGVPEHEAKIMEDTVNKGAILIAVETKDDASAEKVKSILKDSNAQSIKALAA